MTDLSDLKIGGVPVFGGAGRDISGSTYFVDNNSGVDTQPGDSWATAFKTLAKAVTVSNADIARGSDRWARRNTIYFAADTETATLAAFPNKCDVIGVGSYDANDKPGITGNHVPVNTGNYGTRFFNIWFRGAAVAGPIVTLASTSSGIQFIGCTFSAPASGTTNTIGIQATASPFLKVKGCRFEGPFTTSYITFGTGEAGGTEIVENIMMDSADNGIVTGAGTTATWRGLIKKNHVQCADKTIDTQATSVFDVVDNTLISAEALGASAYVIDLTYAVGNRITGNDISATIPVIPAS